jgi:hypothetical protein
VGAQSCSHPFNLRYDLRVPRPLRLVRPPEPNARCANPDCAVLRKVRHYGKVKGRTYAADEPCPKCGNLLVIAV